MKKLIITLIASLTLTSASAQDTLVLTNGTKMIVKIIEEGKTSVRCKSQTKSDLMVHEIKKENIHLIKFENGTTLALGALNISYSGYEKNIFGSKQVFYGNGMGNNHGRNRSYRSSSSNRALFNGLASLLQNICSSSQGGLFCR